MLIAVGLGDMGFHLARIAGGAGLLQKREDLVHLLAGQAGERRAAGLEGSDILPVAHAVGVEVGDDCVELAGSLGDFGFEFLLPSGAGGNLIVKRRGDRGGGSGRSVVGARNAERPGR